MTRTVPVRCLISLMTFALGLSIALPSHAVTVAEAVAAARNTQLPDIDGIMANHDGVLDAVGGGSTEGLDDVKNLWADGKGTLTGSAEATVIECRGKTDTTCRAIQVLDKAFPERPVIGEDVLAGRDEIVNNPTVTPDDNDTCKDVTIEADPVEVTKTCRAGGWWNEKACRISPVEIGKVTAKYFACAEGEGTSSERSCLTTVSGKPASSVWTERCFFGKESSAASGTVTEETSAVARAIFSGVCTSTDATTETVKCSARVEQRPRLRPGRQDHRTRQRRIQSQPRPLFRRRRPHRPAHLRQLLLSGHPGEGVQVHANLARLHPPKHRPPYEQQLQGRLRMDEA